MLPVGSWVSGARIATPAPGLLKVPGRLPAIGGSFWVSGARIATPAPGLLKVRRRSISHLGQKCHGDIKRVRLVTDLVHRPCPPETQGKTFNDIGNVHVCNNGISSIYERELPEQLSVHCKHDGSHTETNVRHIYKIGV